ncbi:AEC family transporter [bacterium]|nr:AEC family transporter [bacterium]
MIPDPVLYEPMSLFFILLVKLLPLYLVVFVGFIAGKRLDVKTESIASLLIYAIAPVVIFSGTATAPLTAAAFSLPVLFFGIACLMCVAFYWIAGRIWNGSERNILAFTSGTGNTGYFGIPVALALFDETTMSLVVLSILGFVFFENTLGFFVTARGHHTARESALKVLKLPTIYAFLAGLVVNVCQFGLPIPAVDLITNVRGTYTILGMMLVGLGLSRIQTFSVDARFTGVAFLAKFLVWPSVALLVILMDAHFFHFYSNDIYRVILLMSTVPLASNTVAFATKLNTHPEKAAVAVLLSTLFALVYIPLTVAVSSFVLPG